MGSKQWVHSFLVSKSDRMCFTLSFNHSLWDFFLLQYYICKNFLNERNNKQKKKHNLFEKFVFLKKYTKKHAVQIYIGNLSYLPNFLRIPNTNY